MWCSIWPTNWQVFDQVFIQEALQVMQQKMLRRVRRRKYACEFSEFFKQIIKRSRQLTQQADAKKKFFAKIIYWKKEKKKCLDKSIKLVAFSVRATSLKENSLKNLTNAAFLTFLNINTDIIFCFLRYFISKR